MRLALSILLLSLAAQAQTTRYVSPTGSHSTPFATWATAATNIQAAIDAASAGDTIIVAPGTYNAAVTINKNNLTVQGGNGTLWDADRTIIDRQGALNSVGVTFSGATNSTLRGFTVMGATVDGIYHVGWNAVDSCIVRGNNYGIRERAPVFGDPSSTISAIIVGNAVGYETYRAFNNIAGCILEANSSAQLVTYSGGSPAQPINTIFGNTSGTAPINLGGNITNSTTNSVCRLLNIAQASSGVGTNLQWAGVAAYIPRIASLAQNAGVGYTGIEAAKSGDGGPAFLPSGAKFLGRDSTTNANHGSKLISTIVSTSAPPNFVDSARFDGTTDSGIAVLAPHTILPATNSFAVSAWIKTTNTTLNRTVASNGRSWLGFAMFIQSGRLSAFISEDTGASKYIAAGNTSTIADGTWRHISMVVDRGANQMRVILDGATNATANISTFTNTLSSAANFIVGKSLSGTTLTTMQGEISDVRFYNFAKTDFSDRTNRLTGTEAGLVGYWRLDETETPITTGPFNIRNPTLQHTFMEAF